MPKPGALSPRELEIVRLIADGMVNKDIAVILKLSKKTVETHRANINSKLFGYHPESPELGMGRTALIVRWAMTYGLVGPVETGKGTPDTSQDAPRTQLEPI